MDTNLDGHEGQLSRYFNSTVSVSLAIITNGVEWRLYTDTAEPNRLDSQPFFICRLDAAEQGLDVLARFCRATFDSDLVRDYATELRYTTIIASFLRRNLDLREREPEESLIRWILGELKEVGKFSGIVNVNVVNRFRPIIKAALTRTVREIVRRSISAMEEEAAPASVQLQLPPPIEVIIDSQEKEVGTARAIITTEDELAFYETIKEIFNRSPFNGGMINEPARRRKIPIELGYKDTTAYFGIFFNKPAWWFLRTMVGINKWIGFNLPLEIGVPLIPEQIKILPKSSYAPIRVEFNELEDLRLLEPIILAAMEYNVQQRDRDQDDNLEDDQLGQVFNPDM